jgi:serine/threonine protein phosphatase PrpC
MRFMYELHPVLKPPRPDKKPREQVTKLTDADFIENSGIRTIQPSNEEIEEIEEVYKNPEPGEFQESDVVDAFKIPVFKGIEVAATLEKNNKHKGTEERNQDNIIADPETGLIGVLDGMSGMGKEGDGAKASMIAAHEIPERFAKLLKMPGGLANVRERLIDHQLVRKNPSTPELKTQYRKQLTDMVEGMLEKDPEMGRRALALIEAVRQTNKYVQETGGMTTATVGFVHETPDGQRWAVVASIGDSSAMKRRENGELVPITREDSLLNSLLDSGYITEEQVRDLRANPKKKIMVPALEFVYAMGGGQAEFEEVKARGIEQISVDHKLLKGMVAGLGGSKGDPALSIHRLEPGNELIIASDGLTGSYKTAEGKTDLRALGEEFKGGAITENLDNVRKAVKARISPENDDDIGIIIARIIEQAA